MQRLHSAREPLSMQLLLQLDRSFFRKLDQSFLSIVAKCLTMQLSLKLDRWFLPKLDQQIGSYILNAQKASPA